MRTGTAAAAWAVAALSAAALAPADGWVGGGDGTCHIEGVAMANGSYAEALFQATVSEATTSTWIVWYNRTVRRGPGGRATASPPQQQQWQPNASVVIWQHDAGVRPDEAELARTGGCPSLSGAADPALRVAGYSKLVMFTCRIEPSSSPSTEALTCMQIVATSARDDGARLVFGLSVCDPHVTGAVRYFVNVNDAYRVSSCPLQESPLALVIGVSLLAAGALLLAVAGACFLARHRRRDAAAAAPEERVELRAAS